MSVASFAVASSDLPESYELFHNVRRSHGPSARNAEEDESQGHAVCSSNATINPGWPGMVPAVRPAPAQS